MALTENFIRQNAMSRFLSVVEQIALVTGPSTIDKDTKFVDLEGVQFASSPVRWMQKERTGDSVVAFFEDLISLTESTSYTHVVLTREFDELLLSAPITLTTTVSKGYRVRMKVSMKEVPY